MSSKRKNKNVEGVSEGGQMFRYRVELRDLRDGSTRALPLHTIVKIHIPTKKSEQQRPSQELLQLKDGAATLEAENFDDLVTQLRRKYPDEAYERTLRRERDFQVGLLTLERRSAQPSGLPRINREAGVHA